MTVVWPASALWNVGLISHSRERRRGLRCRPKDAAAEIPRRKMHRHPALRLFKCEYLQGSSVYGLLIFILEGNQLICKQCSRHLRDTVKINIIDRWYSILFIIEGPCWETMCFSTWEFRVTNEILNVININEPVLFLEGS